MMGTGECLILTVVLDSKVSTLPWKGVSQGG